ncbi:MAG: hypothetical protein SFU91_02155 [Chloroherpetonaceae bacterium]|nr:hypothetical protein [Chloroherpetonaceae bacterium]
MSKHSRLMGMILILIRGYASTERALRAKASYKLSTVVTRRIPFLLLILSIYFILAIQGIFSRSYKSAMAPLFALLLSGSLPFILPFSFLLFQF